MKREYAAAAVVVAMVLALAACGGSSNKASPVAATNTASVSTAFTVDQLPALVTRVEPTVVTVLTNLGEGSGIIWSSNGTIVTNNHVIANASSITVQFADGKQVPAKVHAADSFSDTAVLDVARTNLPPAKWATTTPAVGTFVVAIGNPLGLTNSASIGIVSGANRNIPGSGASPIADLLQTSAPISPGNSGGALIDDQGAVVGMTEAYLPPSTGAVSIGLAIPAPTVVDTVKQLLATGRATHTYLGASTETLTSAIAQQLGVNASSGVIVVSVATGGPAAKAGIAPGDLITQLDNTQLQTTADLVLAVRQHKPGDVVTIHYLRSGTSRTTKVTLASRAT
ncbi:MAG: serine protease [Actinomycetia bacterium]|nr:serine protease [Actinomycetes bacterium]